MARYFACCFLIMLCLAVDVCHSQQPFKLKNVAKFIFFSNGPAASFFTPRKKIEIVLEDKLLKCYQTLAISEFGTKRDTQRRYVKDANKGDLLQLLKIINKADTCLRLKKFRIDKKLLIKYIDSTSRYHRLLDAQRPALIKFLTNNDSLQKALSLTLQKMGQSDFSYKYIYIVTKQNDTLKINANSSKIFYLPWSVNNKVYYDPQIDMLFDRIVSAKIYDLNHYHSWYSELIKCGYMLCFHTNRSLRFFYFEKPTLIKTDFRDLNINP